MSDTPSPDPNETAHRAVGEATAAHEGELPADLEAAWAEWSKGVKKVDERGMALLRAAFEAGYSASSAASSSNSGE